MKHLFQTATIILLIAGVVFCSCKKDKSCEGCINGNKPPTAIAGPDQTIDFPTDGVLLDGTSSTDPDGSIIKWSWAKLSGPASLSLSFKSSGAIQARASQLVPGVYEFQLTVTDNNSLQSKDTVQVMVHDPTPIANAGTDITITLPANTINLDGSASTDPDNDIASYQWTKILGPSSFTIVNANAVQTQLTGLVGGVYQFELKVTDNGGLSAKDTMQVMVDDPSPLANAGRDTIIVLPANIALLDGSGSSDPDNNIATYQWTKISGPSSFTIANANALQTQVTGLAEGVYQFELKVTDSPGLFDKDSVTITVKKTNEIIFNDLSWQCWWGCWIEIPDLYSHIPSGIPFRVFIKRDNTNIWEEAIYESQTGYGFMVDNNYLIVWGGGENDNDTPDIKIIY